MIIYSLIINDSIYLKMKKYYQVNESLNNNSYFLNIFIIQDLKITIDKNYKVIFQTFDYDLAFKHYKYWNQIKNEMTEQYNIIGSSSFGINNFFGPLVISSCYLKMDNKKLINDLKILNPNDLSDEEINKIAPILIANIEHYAIIITNEHYNNLFKKWKNKYIIKMLSQIDIINKLALKVNCNQAIINQFISSQEYHKYLKLTKTKNFLHLTFINQADNNYLVVAIATIISRFYYLKKVLELQLNYGIKLVLDPIKNENNDLKKLKNFIHIKKIAKLDFKVWQENINNEE